MELTEEQWKEAKDHFDAIYDEYISLLGMPGVSALPAIALTLAPLFHRYSQGERSKELYDEMLAVE